MIFATPAEHLDAELRRLNLLLHREVLRLRVAYQLSLDEFRGLYVSDEQVDQLVADRLLDRPNLTDASTVADLTSRAEALRVENAERIPPGLPWSRLAAEWCLSPFEQDVLLLALAPELDLKYETIYGYLNNDVTRRWPTFDLALRLFAPLGHRDLSLRRLLLPEGPLFRDGLLVPVRSGTERPSWLSAGFSVAPVVARFVMGLSCDDPTTSPFLATCGQETGQPLVLRSQLETLSRLYRDSDRQAPVVVFEGRDGTGRRSAAAAVCREADLPILTLDLAAFRREASRPAAEPCSRLADAVVLRQRLEGTALLLTDVESLWDRDGHPWPDARALVARLAAGGRPLLLVSEPGTPWRELTHGLACLVVSCPEPDHEARRTFWEESLDQRRGHAEPADIEALAARFVLTADQIQAAATAAVDLHRARGEAGPLPLPALLDAARAQSSQALGALATKVPPKAGWGDLVLPLATLSRVKDVAAAIRNRHVVYGRWGFAAQAGQGMGLGLKVLFSGPSGTGKTMTASVIAADLGQDLYRIDLSSVVSKYIGETEKHLDRVFRASRNSNAVLFFDEADALFGKRSEVKDAHDRYANVETAYLLQRIEEHDGVVILASNLSQNIDAAFLRRLHFVVEFPLPDETHREALWRGMFPPQVPLGEDVDFRFLARQFPLSGGDIRNVALDAAFLAAADGQVVRMGQFVRAVARELAKQGSVPSAADFKQYYLLIS